MGLFSAISKVVRPIGKSLANVSRSPVGTLAKGVPILGTALTAVSVGSMAYDAVKTVRGNNSSGSLPPLPPMGTTGGFGIPKGPDGKMQLPWNDPSIGSNIKPYSLDDQYLRTFYRAPRGYIVMWDGGMPHTGRPFCVQKKFAKTLHYNDGSKVVQTTHKPPISVGEYHSLKKAHKTIKKVNKIHGLLAYVHDHTTSTGKVKVHHKKKGK